MSRMKSSQAKKASITLPEALESGLKELAVKEKRSLSGILQEAARYYLNVREWEALQRELSLKAARLKIRSEDDVDRMIHELRN